jgi:predicted DNA-binding WGR domain protein
VDGSSNEQSQEGGNTGSAVEAVAGAGERKVAVVPAGANEGGEKGSDTKAAAADTKAAAAAAAGISPAVHKMCTAKGAIAGELHCTLQCTRDDSTMYFIMQGVSGGDGKSYLFRHWGRVGGSGQVSCTVQADRTTLEKQFEKVFKSKTANKWEDRLTSFVAKPKKYEMVEEIAGGGEAAAAAAVVVAAAAGAGEGPFGDVTAAQRLAVAADEKARIAEVEREELLQAIELALCRDENETETQTLSSASGSSLKDGEEAEEEEEKRKKRKKKKKKGESDARGITRVGELGVDGSGHGGGNLAVVSTGTKRRRRRPVAEMLASAARSRLFYRASSDCSGSGGVGGLDSCSLDSSSANILALSSPLVAQDEEDADAAAAAAAAAAVAGIAGIADDGDGGGSGGSLSGVPLAAVHHNTVYPSSPNGKTHADTQGSKFVCRGYDGSDVMIDGSNAECARWGYTSGDRIAHAETEMAATVVGVGAQTHCSVLPGICSLDSLIGTIFDFDWLLARYVEGGCGYNSMMLKASRRSCREAGRRCC